MKSIKKFGLAGLVALAMASAGCDHKKVLSREYDNQGNRWVHCDTNNNGRENLVDVYNRKGVLVKTMYHTDSDGIFDRIVEYYSPDIRKTTIYANGQPTTTYISQDNKLFCAFNFDENGNIRYSIKSGLLTLSLGE